LIVDINMMWMPGDLFSNKELLRMYLTSVPEGYDYEVRLDVVPGENRKQIVISKPKGYEGLNYTNLHTDPLIRIKAMDQAGVDKALLRHPCWEEWFSLEACRKVNDLLAKYVSEHSDRVLGLAITPPWGDDESLEELDRAVKDLHLSAVECAAHYGDLYLDAEEFRPFFKKVNQLNVPIIVHHTPVPVEYRSIYEYSNLRRFYGRIIDQMISVSRILYSGLLDKFPNLKFVPTQMGGALWAFTNFVKVPRVGNKEDVGRFDSNPEKIDGYLKNNFFFDITTPTQWTKAQLECAVKEVGADHLLFGGSFPVRPDWLFSGIQHIKSLDIGEKEKKLILGENAMRLLKIKA
jgi:predicted TIM-barrel fold metal-dependent hydrolase